VVTCTDSGGPLEFVIDHETGLAAGSQPDALAEVLDEIWTDRDRAREWGLAGRKRYDELKISWRNVVRHLLA
jgi:glycosyltransferase involved in cell wall biosynthesis